MKHELEHFYVEDSYGGNQDWFRSFMMRIGGCAAETACDSSLYFAIHKGVKKMYPFFDLETITRESYVGFAHLMEPYLKPRISGINSLEIYIKGYSAYLDHRGFKGLEMYGLSGEEPYDEAETAVREQIDAGYPIPTLILNHRNKALSDYVWHWFLINGYDDSDGKFLVKAVTYGGWRWLELRELWDTGYSRKGGFVIYELIEERAEEAPARISELVNRNGYACKLNTIHDVMEITGISLAEAKDMVDAYYENEIDYELHNDLKKNR